MHINDVLVLQNDIMISLLRILVEQSSGEEGGLTEFFETKIQDIHKLSEDWRAEE